VIATAPPADAVVLWNTKVRVNVSKGPKPVAIPSGLIGEPYANVLGALQGAGFAVKRGPDAESDLPKDTVVSTDPPPGTAAPPGSTVTVTVSKGPKTTGVPDVTSYSQEDATATLESAGFKPVVITTPTSDPTLDGFVISQDPPADAQAKPGAKVKIVVGDLAVEPPPATTAPAATTTTTPAATATPTVAATTTG
jgi:serine/threonine-protein kinase